MIGKESTPTIRRARRIDIGGIKTLEEDLNLSPWSSADYLLEIERADSVFLVCSEFGQIIAFVLARLITNVNMALQKSTTSDNNRTITEIEIFNIGVSQHRQRSGLGHHLLTALLRETARYNPHRIMLDVRKKNRTAISFYEKHHFYTIGERKNFYQNPQDDSLVMRLDLRSFDDPRT